MQEPERDTTSADAFSSVRCRPVEAMRVKVVTVARDSSNGPQFKTRIPADYTFAQLAQDAARFWGLDARERVLKDRRKRGFNRQDLVLETISATAMRPHARVLVLCEGQWGWEGKDYGLVGLPPSASSKGRAYSMEMGHAGVSSARSRCNSVGDMLATTPLGSACQSPLHRRTPDFSAPSATAAAPAPGAGGGRPALAFDNYTMSVPGESEDERPGALAEDKRAATDSAAAVAATTGGGAQQRRELKEQLWQLFAMHSEAMEKARVQHERHRSRAYRGARAKCCFRLSSKGFTRLLSQANLVLATPATVKSSASASAPRLRRTDRLTQSKVQHILSSNCDDTGAFTFDAFLHTLIELVVELGVQQERGRESSGSGGKSDSDEVKEAQDGRELLQHAMGQAMERLLAVHSIWTDAAQKQDELWHSSKSDGARVKLGRCSQSIEGLALFFVPGVRRAKLPRTELWLSWNEFWRFCATLGLPSLGITVAHARHVFVLSAGDAFGSNGANAVGKADTTGGGSVADHDAASEHAALLSRSFDTTGRSRLRLSSVMHAVARLAVGVCLIQHAERCSAAARASTAGVTSPSRRATTPPLRPSSPVSFGLSHERRYESFDSTMDDGAIADMGGSDVADELSDAVDQMLRVMRFRLPHWVSHVGTRKDMRNGDTLEAQAVADAFVLASQTATQLAPALRPTQRSTAATSQSQLLGGRGVAPPRRGQGAMEELWPTLRETMRQQTAPVSGAHRRDSSLSIDLTAIAPSTLESDPIHGRHTPLTPFTPLPTTERRGEHEDLDKFLSLDPTLRRQYAKHSLAELRTEIEELCERGANTFAEAAKMGGALEAAHKSCIAEADSRFKLAAKLASLSGSKSKALDEGRGEDERKVESETSGGEGDKLSSVPEVLIDWARSLMQYAQQVQQQADRLRADPEQTLVRLAGEALEKAQKRLDRAHAVCSGSEASTARAQSLAWVHLNWGLALCELAKLVGDNAPRLHSTPTSGVVGSQGDGRFPLVRSAQASSRRELLSDAALHFSRAEENEEEAGQQRGLDVYILEQYVRVQWLLAKAFEWGNEKAESRLVEALRRINRSVERRDLNHKRASLPQGGNKPVLARLHAFVLAQLMLRHSLVRRPNQVLLDLDEAVAETDETGGGEVATGSKGTIGAGDSLGDGLGDLDFSDFAVSTNDLQEALSRAESEDKRVRRGSIDLRSSIEVVFTEVGEKVIENIFHRMASSKRGHEPVLSRQNVIELNNELQRRSTAVSGGELPNKQGWVVHGEHHQTISDRAWQELTSRYNTVGEGGSRGITLSGFKEYCVDLAANAPVRLHQMIVLMRHCEPLQWQLQEKEVERAPLGRRPPVRPAPGPAPAFESTSGPLQHGRRTSSRTVSESSLDEAKRFPSAPAVRPVLDEAKKWEVEAKKIAAGTQRIAEYLAIMGPTAGEKLDADQYVVNSSKTEIMESRSPKDLILNASLICKFPHEEHQDLPLPKELKKFAFPEDIHMATGPAAPTHFDIVLTDIAGKQLYAACFIFHEEWSVESIRELVRRKLEAESESEAADEPADDQSVHLSEDGGDDKAHSELPAWLRDERNQPRFFVPKCLCIISRWPCFQSFKAVMRQLYRIAQSPSRPIPLECYITNFMRDVPVPPRGIMHVQFKLADRIVMFERSPVNTLPSLDVKLDPLFLSLSVDNILVVLSCILTEQKVALCSRYLGLLTPVAEALRSFMFPFEFSVTYIPVLPKALYEFLYAPVPFLMGMHSDYLREYNTIDGVVFVNLDDDEVKMPPDVQQGLPPLPEQAASKLRKKLGKAVSMFNKLDSHTKQQRVVGCNLAYPRGTAEADMPHWVIEDFGLSAGQEIVTDSSNAAKRRLVIKTMSGRAVEEVDELEVRNAFLSFMVTLLLNYKKCMCVGSAVDSGDIEHGERLTSDIYFNKDEFLRSNSQSAPLCRQLFETQLFERFIEQRVDPRLKDSPTVIFFDEQIALRSKGGGFFGGRSAKPETPLLDNTTLAASRVFAVRPPQYDRHDYRPGGHNTTKWPELVPSKFPIEWHVSPAICTCDNQDQADVDAERLTAQSVLNTAQPNDPVDGVTTPRVAGAMQSSLHEGRVHRRNSLHRRLSGIGLQELMGQQGGGVAPQQAALNDMQQRINQLQAVLDHTSRAKDHFQSKAAQEADRNRKLSSKNNQLEQFVKQQQQQRPPQTVDEGAET